MPENFDFPSYKSADWASAAKKELKDLKQKNPKKQKLSPDETEEVIPDKKGVFIKGKRVKGISDRNIQSLLNENILEVVFTRRMWPLKMPGPGQQSPIRRMMATANWNFLNKNKDVFKWKTPNGSTPRSKKWYKKNRLLIVQDLIRQDWRHISLNEYSIINLIPIKTQQQQDDFIKKYKILFKKHGRKKLIKWFNR